MNSNSNNICGIHNKSLKFICYDCNVLMCSVCSPKHARHSYDHIDNIKANINKNKSDLNAYSDDNELNNNNNNNNNNIRFNEIQRSIQTTFDSLKIKVVEYEQLQQTEHEIESKFKELHEFLVVEEHRLKKPIIESKQQLEQQIDKQIKIMKSLNTVDNQITRFKSNNNDDRSDSQSKTITTADTTDNYQITTIIRSISQCSDHNEFISSNNYTLFYFDYDQLDNKVNNNDDHSLLNVLLEHNNTIKINNNNTDDNQQPQLYQLTVNNEQINSAKNQIQSSFQLKSNQSKIQQNVISNKNNKQSYIFSSDSKNKLSIINITDRNNIHFEPQQDIYLGSSSTFSSMVKVGDFLYIFGANSISNGYIKYSIDNKTLVINEMKGVGQCRFLSTCYDGKDHIYIFDCFNKPKTVIYRYSINDSTFERYSTTDIIASYHLFTFFFKGQIYTLTPATIFQFNINNKTTVELSVKITGNPMAACTDGNGNLYIQSYSGLQRINIETHEIKSFEKSTIEMNGYYYNLIYHQSNDGQSYIYSIRGKNQNYLFSFDNNKWEQILQDDPSDRTNCANILDQK
ncbi:hypothetical protein PPL_09398 [Heterostelium album PN500]|uniref:B box-type domain-containing protein n=1 Tax=Heterostelium pallidum (strain ATCC 26659 / Pp 5 / PN500) TaxID=670386 RepID=D3BLG4_HETP5|nr:hypothetical protein PPL_09398 [Heterostelium album PN500]EFA77898.1 hypothetical protein PPL_09398 [Heterostelium album PN500]|eukprot:XP_020430026.1 hypothetical protein PPL_09398 [Heterostelium album PN500]